MNERRNRPKVEGEGRKKIWDVPCQFHIELSEVVEVYDNAPALLACGEQVMEMRGIGS